VRMAVAPPDAVRGMTVYKPELFSKKVLLPCIQVKAEYLNKIKPALKNYVLKMQNLQCVQQCPNSQHTKIIFFNPHVVEKFSDLNSAQEIFQQTSVDESSFSFQECQLSSDNWKPYEKLKFILPENSETVSGFSRIGHVLHLNLRDHLKDYKQVIGSILLEMPGIRTVVTKTSEIDNTFRNFELEVLAGEPDFEVIVKENGITYRFDFSKVYWNPRLSSEHERIVKMLNKNCILFDACSGVGPFAIPAAKKCKVFANDLNPESFKWLQQNVKLNKIKEGEISCHNEDARDFMKQVFVQQLIAICKPENRDLYSEVELHITMNLPALAITFIDVFQGLLTDYEDKLPRHEIPLPILHVYTFSKEVDTQSDVRRRVEHYLDYKLDDQHLKEIAFVRDVSPNKDMLRATLKVPLDVLYREKKDCTKRKSDEQSDNNENNKKHKQ